LIVKLRIEPVLQEGLGCCSNTAVVQMVIVHAIPVERTTQTACFIHHPWIDSQVNVLPGDNQLKLRSRHHRNIASIMFNNYLVTQDGSVVCQHRLRIHCSFDVDSFPCLQSEIDVLALAIPGEVVKSTIFVFDSQVKLK